MSGTTYVNFSGSQRLTENEYDALGVLLGEAMEHGMDEWLSPGSGLPARVRRAMLPAIEKWKAAGVRAHHVKIKRAAKTEEA